jgi:fumarate reductase subunit C
MRNRKSAVSGLIFVLVLIYTLFSFGEGHENGLSEVTFYVQ